jgi:LCP family protein required for cell wall assembly
MSSPHDSRQSPATGAPHCAGCGREADPAWHYCPHCGRSAAAGSADTAGIVPISTAASGSVRRRRRHRRKPYYRRKRIVVPAFVTVCAVLVIGAMLYRTDSILSTVRQISTPPPVITDNTYEMDDTPGRLEEPVTVDTGPARAALEEAHREHDLPLPVAGEENGGFGRLSAGVQDIAGGAAVASGLQDPASEGFTMLVMGVDARPGKPIDIGVRPDVLMLVRFEPETRSCQMLSIPRDTRVELPGYGESKINHALMVGGIPYQLLVTEDFVGAPIDHYALVDFVAFSQIVDTLGGVTVTVPEDLTKQGTVRFEAGTHRFDGNDALAYARFRTASGGGDLDRVERQWSLLASVARAASGRDLVGDVNGLLPVIEDHVRTDLTLTEMAEIARTYGTGCLAIDGESVDMLRGARVELEDPILNQVLSYNVVAQPVVQAQVDELVGSDTERSPIERSAGYVVAALIEPWLALRHR